MAKRLLVILVLSLVVGNGQLTNASAWCSCSESFDGYDAGSNFVGSLSNSHGTTTNSDMECQQFCWDWYWDWFAVACSVHSLDYGDNIWQSHSWGGSGSSFGPRRWDCP